MNPVSGRPELVLVSAAKEKEIGREEAERVAQEMGLLSGAPLSAYLESVGHRLAVQSPRRDVAYTFHVVDMPEPNAFALPGGFVYISRGLLALLSSEDELAGVVGHEIGHIAARHSVRQISRQAPLAILTGLGAAATSIVSPMLGRAVGGLGDFATGLVLAPYSREQEREADRLGQEIAARAGWDPNALSRALHTLEREESLWQQGARRPRFFDTHPATPERVAATTQYAATLTRKPRPPTALSAADFLRQLDGLVVGASAADGVVEGQNLLHPDFDFVLQFPPRWQVQNSRAQVTADAPDGAALVLLRVVASGNDPLSGARGLEQAAGAAIVQRTQRLTINGLPGARTRVNANSEHGQLGINLVWIAHAGRVFQIAGIAALRHVDRYEATFDAIAQSFRPLQPPERAAVRETRLRIIAARGNEQLAAAVARSQSSWNTEMVAVANGLDSGQSLPAGQLLKVAVTEPYRSDH
jgi:predicted Zn-dependent protease